MVKKIERSILAMSHAYFAVAGKKVTPEEIREFIKRSEAFYSEESIDVEWLYRKLHVIHLTR